jgi:AraC-like DNA-binding protein
VLIDPLTPHRIEAGQEATLVYVEPGKHLGSEVETLLSQVRSASSFAMVSSAEGERFWAGWLASPAATAGHLDARLAPAVEYIEGALMVGPVPLQDAAARSALSPERFRHLFADEIGLPFRRYVLWRRLRLATTELMAGQDVTTAAHAAGFSDAAHFARTLRSTFGVTASQALLSR